MATIETSPGAFGASPATGPAPGAFGASPSSRPLVRPDASVPSRPLGEVDVAARGLSGEAGAAAAEGRPLLGPDWVADAASGRRWSSPVGDLRKADGRLGRGAYGDVHRLLDDAGQSTGYVAKEYGKNTGYSAPHLDDARRVGRARATAVGSDNLEKAGVLQADLYHVDPRTGFIVQREVGRLTPPGVKGEVIIEDLLERGNISTLSPQRSEAVVDVIDDLNKTGIAIEDPNKGNLFLREFNAADRSPVAGVLDQDRIIGANEFAALEHLEYESRFLKESVARENNLVINDEFWRPANVGGEAGYESLINLDEFRNVRNGSETRYFRLLQKTGLSFDEISKIGNGRVFLADVKAFNYYTLIEKGWIKFEPGVGFSSGYLDLGTVVRRFPELPETLHLPAGTQWDALRSRGEIRSLRPPRRHAMFHAPSLPLAA